MLFNNRLSPNLPAVGVPVVFDTHHFECYKLLHPNETFEEMSFYIPDILKSWGTIKTKFHISEQGSGKIGHHSDFIENIPQCMPDIPKDYNVNIDIMIEAKKKKKNWQFSNYMPNIHN